jgi:hypothetical protein
MIVCFVVMALMVQYPGLFYKQKVTNLWLRNLR